MLGTREGRSLVVEVSMAVGAKLGPSNELFEGNISELKDNRRSLFYRSATYMVASRSYDEGLRINSLPLPSGTTVGGRIGCGAGADPALVTIENDGARIVGFWAMLGETTGTTGASMDDSTVGISDGTMVGWSEGMSDGAIVGAFVGAAVGDEHHCGQAIGSPFRPGIANWHFMGALPLTTVLGGVAESDSVVVVLVIVVVVFNATSNT
jgi:hypothetical protein